MNKIAQTTKFYLICVLLSVFTFNAYSQTHTYGSQYFGDALVHYVLTGSQKKSTVVMIHGSNLSTYIFTTTPDGRDGWSELFADDGYDVYMINDPRFDFATGGFSVPPFTVPTGGPPATPGSQQGWQTDIW